MGYSKLRCMSFVVIVAMVVSMVAAVAPAFGTNLVSNGDFEAGNTGFFSDYAYVSATGHNTLGPPFVYSVGVNPYLYHSAWSSFWDHTYGDGTGMMMIVNGTTVTPPGVVWGQEVALPECDPVSSYPLYAGQDILVGEVLVKSENGKVCVKYALDTDALEFGWLITEVHVAVADTAAGIPQTKKGNPIPGQFAVGEYLDPGVPETEWYCFDRDPAWADPLAVAAHAVVTKTDTVVNALAPYGPTEVTNAEQGLRYDYTPVRSVRSDPEAALTFTTGANEANFFSLGFREDREAYLPLENAFVEVRFDTPVLNGVGPDVRIIEDTWGLPYPTELAGVWAKAEAGDDWTWLGVADNQNPYLSYHTITDLDLGPLASASYVKVQDMSLRADFASRYPSQAETLDGFDVNAVVSLQDNRRSTTYGESAWAGEVGFPGKNWATYISYTPKVCSTDYVLEFYAASSHPTAPAQLQVTINGEVVPPPLELPATTGEWVRYGATWDAGAATSARIEIRDLRVTYSGDDFCIDDISFVKQ